MDPRSLREGSCRTGLSPVFIPTADTFVTSLVGRSTSNAFLIHESIKYRGFLKNILLSEKYFKTNNVVENPERSTPTIKKTAIIQDPRSVPSTSHCHKLSPKESSQYYPHISTSVLRVDGSQPL
jgi:hypothetical protein